MEAVGVGKLRFVVVIVKKVLHVAGPLLGLAVMAAAVPVVTAPAVCSLVLAARPGGCAPVTGHEIPAPAADQLLARNSRRAGACAADGSPLS